MQEYKKLVLEGFIVNEEFKELLKQQGISNQENPTEADIKKYRNCYGY
jgi:hypothetical protein